MNKLSIVIPVFNNWNFTKSCLIDLAKLPSDHQIIVVDNNSTDDTVEHLGINFDTAAMPQNFRYIRLDNNYGFAKACNIGFEASWSDHVMFLNNDIRVRKDKDNWTDIILNEANAALVGPTGGLLDDDLNFVCETNKILPGNFYMSGWNITASKNLWKKLIPNDHVGPFSEEFGLAYFEDTDLGFRARALGVPFKIVDVPVHHFGKMTSKNLNLSSLYLLAKEKFVNKWKTK